MTLLELITNCINYTTQDDEEVNPLTLEQFKDSSNYKAFIKNALYEVNRAIQEIVAWRKLPLQVMEFVNDSNQIIATSYPQYKRIRLTDEQWNKIYRIYKVEIETSDGKVLSPVEYRRLSNELRVPSFNGTLFVHYYPSVKIFTEADKGTTIYDDENDYNTTDNSVDLRTYGLNDVLCNIVIPCLVKANIWQEVEPELAQLERNKGLQNLNMMYNGEEEPYQTSVARTNTFNWGE